VSFSFVPLCIQDLGFGVTGVGAGTGLLNKGDFFSHQKKKLLLQQDTLPAISNQTIFLLPQTKSTHLISKPVFSPSTLNPPKNRPIKISLNSNH
jgi:hypothetical protein